MRSSGPKTLRPDLRESYDEHRSAKTPDRRPHLARSHEAYNYEVGIKPLIEKAVGVQTFRADGPAETEFMTISYWESVEAMSRFTGGDPARIHHLSRDAEFLIELPERVQILTIVSSSGNSGST